MADYHARRTTGRPPIRRRIELMPGVELCVYLPMEPAPLAALEEVARLAAQALLPDRPAAGPDLSVERLPDKPVRGVRLMRKSAPIDILTGSRIVQAGRHWIADISIGSGRWRAHASARASNPTTAAHRAILAARDGIRREQRREEGLDA